MPSTTRLPGLILEQASDAVAAATRANVAIYAIDPRGLSAFEEGIEAAGTPSDVTPSQFSVTGSLLDSLRLSQQSLQVLANETGGFAAINRNDFAGAFERVVRENSAYYMLGLLSDQRPPGRPVPPHRGSRQAARLAGALEARLRGAARTCAESARRRQPPTRSMRRSAPRMNSPIPTTGIPLSVSAAAYKGAAPNASVALAVEMRADAFRFAEKNGMLTDRVQVAFSSVDAKGTIRPGQKHVLTMEMSADNRAARARAWLPRGVGSVAPARPISAPRRGGRGRRQPQRQHLLRSRRA